MNNEPFVLGLIKATKVKHGKNMYEHGQIKFGVPKEWEEQGKKYGQGQGDIFEGTIATVCCDETETIHHWNKIPDFYTLQIGNKVYLKNKRSMQLPCFCAYILTDKMLSKPTDIGEQTLTGEIPPEYFRDFASNLTVTQIEKLPYLEQPAIVYIKDLFEFEKRLRKYLIEYVGVQAKDIITRQVEYVEWDEPVTETYIECPLELFFKDKQFSHQQEWRVIINTDDEEVKKRLLSKPIAIGTLESIAYFKDGYLKDGISIEVDALIKRKGD